MFTLIEDRDSSPQYYSQEHSNALPAIPFAYDADQGWVGFFLQMSKEHIERVVVADRLKTDRRFVSNR